MSPRYNMYSVSICFLHKTAFLFVLLVFSFALFAAVSPVYAGGTGLPWEEPLDKVIQSIEGPVAKAISIAIIVIAGLTLAVGDTSGGFKRLIQIIFGLTIAFSATSFFLSFFKFSGGAVI